MKKWNVVRRAAAWLLTMVMLVSALPLSTLAEENLPGAGTGAAQAEEDQREEVPAVQQAAETQGGKESASN